MADPTLEDDETTLANYAAALADAVSAIASDWLSALIEARAPGLANSSHAVAAVQAGARQLDDQLRGLLVLDLSEQTTGPLEILRRAVHFPTAVLRDAGVAPVSRDDFAVRNFPDDTYALTPASFADVHPSLLEPGLMWGAAKAHVHLRRRREAEPH